MARRRVFYIPGFDPQPPRRYRELYRREGAAQAALSGYVLDQWPGPDRASWRVTARFGPAEVETMVSVLPWADLVRGAMAPGLVAGWGRMARTAWIYLASGALWRLLRLGRGPVLAVLYPAAVMLAVLALAVAGAGAAARLAAAMTPVVAGGVALLAGGAVSLALLALLRAADRWLYVQYLWDDFAFAAAAGGAYPPALEARLPAFRRAVAEALAGDWDEVLLVGHSLGAQIAVTVLADALRGRAPAKRPAVGLLTLGQVIPMQSFLPQADRLRADLCALAGRDDLAWVDVTAPGDGCCFALCDPVAVTGVAPARARGPLVISAAFRQTLRPDTWTRLRWRFFRLHFQYLCAFDNLPGRPGDYDYFAVTAGPMTLAARFADRAASPARRARAASGHRRLAA